MEPRSGASGRVPPLHPDPQRLPALSAPHTYFWMIWGRPAWGGCGGIPRGPGGTGGAGAPGTLRASRSACSGPLGSASWLMAAASTMCGEGGPGPRRESAREGRPRGTGAHWPGSPCPVPLSFPGGAGRRREGRGGDSPSGAASSWSLRSCSAGLSPAGVGVRGRLPAD